MTTYPTTDLQYSWSLDLSKELLLDDFTLSWLTMTTELILSTGIGATESYQEGPTTLHYIEVPTGLLVGCPHGEELLILEVTTTSYVTLVHLRLVSSGFEPTMDTAWVEVSS